MRDIQFETEVVSPWLLSEESAVTPGDGKPPEKDEEEEEEDEFEDDEEEEEEDAE